jgi:hypothetical protein
MPHTFWTKPHPFFRTMPCPVWTKPHPVQITVASTGFPYFSDFKKSPEPITTVNNKLLTYLQSADTEHRSQIVFRCVTIMAGRQDRFSDRPCFIFIRPLHTHCKKGYRFSQPLPRSHYSPWPGISDIPAGDGKNNNLFYSVQT